MAETPDTTQPLTAVFRLEWGGVTGWGHVVRCSALAGELRTRGWECALWTSGDPRGLPDEVREAFNGPRIGADAGDCAGELPPPVAAADWLVVDHYGCADAVLRGWRTCGLPSRSAKVPRLLVIDDQAQRKLEVADLVLNSRLGLTQNPYAQGVNTLLGERYALLRPGLRRPDPVAASFLQRVDPVLIMMGGTDPAGLTLTVLEVLAEVDASRVVPVLVRGRKASSPGGLRRALSRFPANVRLDGISAATLAGWARSCRFAISAAGGSLYEFAFLQLPFVAIAVAENQLPLTERVKELWNVPVLDGRSTDHRFRLREAIRQLWGRPPGWGATRAAIDGQGAERVADVLCQ